MATSSSGGEGGTKQPASAAGGGEAPFGAQSPEDDVMNVLGSALGGLSVRMDPINPPRDTQNGGMDQRFKGMGPWAPRATSASDLRQIPTNPPSSSAQEKSAVNALYNEEKSFAITSSHSLQGEIPSLLSGMQLKPFKNGRGNVAENMAESSNFQNTIEVPQATQGKTIASFNTIDEKKLFEQFNGGSLYDSKPNNPLALSTDGFAMNGTSSGIKSFNGLVLENENGEFRPNPATFQHIEREEPANIRSAAYRYLPSDDGRRRNSLGGNDYRFNGTIQNSAPGRHAESESAFPDKSASRSSTANAGPFSQELKYAPETQLDPQHVAMPQQPNPDENGYTHYQGGSSAHQSPKQHEQLLYMAIPTQDGRGQIFQPVRMVHVNGKSEPLVLQSDQHQDSGLPAPQGPAPPQQSNTQQLHPSASQPYLLPILPSHRPYSASLSSGEAPGQWRKTRESGFDKTWDYSLDHANGPDLSADAGYFKDHTSVYQPTTSEPFLANNGRSEYTSAPGFYESQSDHPGYTRPDSLDYAPNLNQSNIDHFHIGGNNRVPSDVISSLYSSPQRPELGDLLSHIRRLSRDQVGCRLLQQALDEEGSTAATMILNEGLSFWGEAMIDPFGNYLFQKMLEKITPQERIVLLQSVSSRLANASLNLHGTRSVQKVVELCAMDEAIAASSLGHFYSNGINEQSAADILIKSLAPSAARLCIDSHGNHVIQRILQKFPYHHSQFVFDAVATSVGDVARHRHGCCVIQRCLDSPPSAARKHLVRRIVEKALELMQDAYGNYVVQYVLDVCEDEDVHAVCETVVGKVNLLAIQKFSSNVMEKCLERCTDRVRELYMKELSEPERIRELMMDPFGNYVIQRALVVATHAQAVRLVAAMRPHLIQQQQGGHNNYNGGAMRNSAGGRRILAKICSRFPSFNLSGDGPLEDQQKRRTTRHYTDNNGDTTSG